MPITSSKRKFSRRSAIQSFLALAGTVALPLSSKASEMETRDKTKVKITKLETFLVKPRWIFLKVHTDAGVIGLGEPLLEGRALTIQTAIKEIEPYLIGKDPRQVTHHWQAIYRHAFYRGGPILTSALSGIDQALWDIKGKLLGVPVYELFGGPTRDRVRIYGRASNAEQMKQRVQEGYTVIKNWWSLMSSPRGQLRIQNLSSMLWRTLLHCARRAAIVWISVLIFMVQFLRRLQRS